MSPSPSIESKGNRYSISELPFAGSGGHVGLRGLFEGRLIVGITLFSTLGGFLVGYDQAIMSSIVTEQSFGAAFLDLYMNEMLLIWCISTLLLAAIFGAFVNGPICDKLGRRGDIKLNALIFLLGSSLQTGATSSSYLFAGRVISGWALGALTHAIPMYIAEISTANIRGSLISLQQLAIAVGLVVGYWIAYVASYIGGIQCAPGVPYTGPLFDGIPTFDPYNDVPSGGCTGQTQASWRVPLGLQLFPALCLAVGMFFMPHSPRWLMEQGREEEALQTLSNLRKKSVDDHSVRLEFLEIMADIRYAGEVTNAAHPNAGPFELLTHKKMIFFTTWKMFRRFAVGCLSLALQQNMTIIYVAPTIFARLGLEQKTTSVLIGLFGLVNILATLPTVILVDSVGRRPLLISGAVGCFISTMVIGILVTVYGNDLPVNGAATRTVIAFVFLFNICFSYSWGPIGWVIPSEIFPLHLRSIGLSYAVPGMWAANFMSVISARILPKNMPELSYYMAAIVCASAFFAAMFLFPETKAFTLERMDVAINKKVSDSERQHRVSIYRELALPVEAPPTV